MGRTRKMDHPKKRVAEEESGKSRKLMKLLPAKNEPEKKGNSAYTAWQQPPPGAGTGFKFSSYVKVKLHCARFNIFTVID